MTFRVIGFRHDSISVNRFGRVVCKEPLAQTQAVNSIGDGGFLVLFTLSSTTSLI